MSTRAYRLQLDLVVSTLDDVSDSQLLVGTRRELQEELFMLLDEWLKNRVFPQDRGSIAVITAEVKPAPRILE
jgi:UDP-N-acetyl-D-mannosaminuronic acid transferase (WecB/TagA/CpsF family)